MATNSEALANIDVDTRPKNLKGFVPATLMGGAFGTLIGMLVGYTLDGLFANYIDVVCTEPGHENGGFHPDGYGWEHDGPTYSDYASTGDSWYLKGSMIGGLVLGVIIAIATVLYMRNKQAQAPASTANLSINSTAGAAATGSNRSAQPQSVIAYGPATHVN